jgi:hypothetical protein
VPEAVVSHMVNRSIKTFSHNYVYYGHRNSEFVFWQNMPASLLVRYAAQRALFNVLCLLFFTYKGRGLSFLQAKIDFVRQISTVRKKRQLVQRSLRVDPAEFRKTLDPNWFRYRRKVLS